jgi:hypothetical protein
MIAGSNGSFSGNIQCSSGTYPIKNVSTSGTTNTVPTIASTNSGSRCGTGTISLGATASAGTINWYTTATGGTSLSTGTSYTTGSISSTTTYYVDATNNGCTTATRSSVVATVNSIPTISSVTPGTRCGTGAVSLSAAASAGTINWYLASTGGISQGTGTSFSTGSISSTTSYFVDATSNGCTTTSRTSVTATVNGLPTITNESLSTQTVCQNITFSSISVTATGTGLTYQWYSNSTASNSGGSAISGATNASYTPPSSALGTMYYYCIVSGTCTPAATSSVSGVFAVQGPLAGTIAITGSSAICTGTSKNLSLSGHSGSIQWQSSSDNSTWSDISGSTSPIFNTGNLTATTYFRAKLSFGSCTPVYTSSQLITVDPLSVAGTISGSAGVCSGSTSALTLTGNTGTIVWTSSTALNGTYSPIAGATSTSYTTAAITATTYYKAVVTSGVCASATTAAYTVSTIPLGNIGAISGPSTATLGGTATYSVTAVTNATSYVWNLPAGMTLASSAGNGASITASVANNFAGGTVTVQAVGCTNSAVVTRTVNAPSAATLSITTTTSGAPVFCGGTTASFSTTTTSTNNSATYLWTLPTGVSVASGSSLSGSSINVVFAANYNGGAISVTRVSSTESLIAYYTVGAIATPGVITGSSTLCGTSSGTYSIASVTGADSYEWSLPTGMTGTSTNTSINVTWTGSITGNIQVRAVKSSCGTSAWRALSVASVATPGSITGPTTTCGANSNTISASGANTTLLNTATYSISAVTGATGYTWTVPTGMAITSGQGTTSINVTITPSSFTSGSVTVIATTSTCTSAVRSLSVSNANSTVVGPTDLCGLSQATYSINAPSGTTVTWTLASWMSLASGQTLTSNPITVNIGAAPSQQNITATYVTSCGTVTGSRFVGCSLFTQLNTTSCGSDVSFTSIVSATWIGAGSYKFLISGGTLSNPVTITNTWNGFTFTQITGAGPGSYSVSVAYAPTGSTNFGSYGSSCSLTLNATIPTTALSACGTTIATGAAVVASTWAGNGTYKFVVSGGTLASGTSVTITNTWNGFTFTQVTGAGPGDYSVISSFKPTGYPDFGSTTTCSSITLGATIPTTALSACGTTIATGATVVASTWAGNGTYKFVVSGGTLASGTSVTITNTWNGFTFTQVTGAGPGDYSVISSFKPTGYPDFGSTTTCSSITLGTTVPTTGIIETQCANGVTSTGTIVTCAWVGQGTYKFVISEGTLGQNNSVTLNQSWNGFTFANIPGASFGGYNITVSFKPTGYPDFGEPTTCAEFELIAAGSLAQQDPQIHQEQTEGLGLEESSNVNGLEENQLQNFTWTATATSNPFAHSFQIKLNGAEGISTDASFTAQLTDMSGKVYSQKTLNKEQLEAESFGEQLAPGLYLMTLRQGEELRVIRVVKR